MSAGAQWRAEVKAALARQAKAQRQRRGRRGPRGIDGPGMVRAAPRGEQEDPPAKGATAFGLTAEQAEALADALAYRRS